MSPSVARAQRAARWAERATPSVAIPDPNLLGVVAHELRTPITTIFAGSKLLKTDRLSGAARGEVVDALAVEAERLRDFVEDLIALAGSAAPPDAPAEPVLLQRTLPSVLEEEAARLPGVRFRAHIPRDLPPVLIDDIAFLRIVRALVVAIGDLGTGGGTIELLARIERGRLVFRVHSRQVHLPIDVIESLFDPAVDPDPQSPRGRIQFSLAAARASARRLGGDVWVRRQRSGFELGLELPVDVDEDA